MAVNEKPAERGRGGPSVSVFSFGGNEHGNDKLTTIQAQPSCDARTLERRSQDCVRIGLKERGHDRLLMLALASTYALAARDAAMMGAGA